MSELTIERRDYSYRDYDKIIDRILNLLRRGGYQTLVNDLNDEQLVKMLSDLVAFISDRDSWTLDYYFNEMFIDTATERRNVESLAKLIGYELQATTSASVDIDCTCSAYASPLSIARGTSIDVDGVKFIVYEDYEFSGETSFVVTFIQGDLYTDSYASTGDENQQFDSTRGSVAQNYEVRVKVGTEYWEETELLSNVLEGNYYELHWITDSKIRVLFGDGIHGSKPPTGMTIEIEYLQCGAEIGNQFGTGTISAVFTGEDDNTDIVEISGTNPESASGGDSEEDVVSAKRNIQKHLRLQDRVVTPDDYVSYSEAYPGIIRAGIDVDNENHLVNLYLLGEGYGTVSSAVKEDLENDLEQRRGLGWFPILQSVDLANIDIWANLFVKRSYDKELSSSRVNQDVYNFFQPQSEEELIRDIGDPVYVSDITRLLDSGYGVEYVDLLKLSRTPRLDYPKWTGVQTINDVEVLSTQVVSEMWTVLFVDGSGTYTVTGSVSGSIPPVLTKAVTEDITGVDIVGNSVKVSGNITADVTSGKSIRIHGSTGNDGEYAVLSSSYSAGPDETTIFVDGNITDATADGKISLIYNNGQIKFWMSDIGQIDDKVEIQVTPYKSNVIFRPYEFVLVGNINFTFEYVS